MNIFKNSIFISTMVNTYLSRCRSRDVLELVCTGLWELILHISFQLYVQWYHVGSLKLNMVEVLTPWKSANSANQGLLIPSSYPWKAVIKYLSYHWGKKPHEQKIFGFSRPKFWKSWLHWALLMHRYLKSVWKINVLIKKYSDFQLPNLFSNVVEIYRVQAYTFPGFAAISVYGIDQILEEFGN